MSAVPPTDLVGANRSRLVEGDTALPLSQVWRKEFDGALGETIAATQARANFELSLTEQHLRSLSFSHKPKGLSAHDMSESQRNDLRQLLKVYINRVNDNVADREWLKLAGDNINDLSFLWAGGIEKGEPPENPSRIIKASIAADKVPPPDFAALKAKASPIPAGVLNLPPPASGTQSGPQPPR